MVCSHGQTTMILLRISLLAILYYSIAQVNTLSLQFFELEQNSKLSLDLNWKGEEIERLSLEINVERIENEVVKIQTDLEKRIKILNSSNISKPVEVGQFSIF